MNIVGSSLMGAVLAWLACAPGEEGWSQPLRLFLATGILGGFTTFSAFSLDAIALWERGDSGLAAPYVAASFSFPSPASRWVSPSSAHSPKEGLLLKEVCAVEGEGQRSWRPS